MKQLIDNLEQRRLLSAVLASGVLTVTGAAKNDEISVSLSKDGTTLTVSESAGSRFKHPAPTKTTFAAADVTSLVINAGAGNDNVSLNGSYKTPFSLAATINGEDGNDNLKGGAGNDTINGGAGDDNLYGNAGDDLLNGDAGDDLIDGGAGTDHLNGGADDDLLISRDRDTTDVLDGGTDSAAAGEDDADTAIVDTGDVITNATTSTGRAGHGLGGGLHGGFGFGGFGGLFGFGGFGRGHR